MFLRICFAKPSTILRLCMQSVDDRGETAVDHLRTKKNLPFAARNAVKGEVEWGDWHFDRAHLGLVLRAEKVVHRFHGIERGEGGFYEDGVPVAHCAVPQPGKFEGEKFATVL